MKQDYIGSVKDHPEKDDYHIPTIDHEKVRKKYLEERVNLWTCESCDSAEEKLAYIVRENEIIKGCLEDLLHTKYNYTVKEIREAVTDAFGKDEVLDFFINHFKESL